MRTVELTIPCGKIKGLETDDCLEFRGIKYANAGRWEYPVQIEKWDGVYDATYHKDCSYQRRAFEDDAVCNEFYHNEFRRGSTFTYSEDCFYLGIQTPKFVENKKAPVIIYIHGGSFTGGSYNEDHINGKELTRSGIIFCAMNYRLGPYGFCAHPDLTDKDGVCGNYGLFDQYIAIKWIKDNIAAFGGDPDNITIMGQSAGAMSVDIHLTNAMCKGWFKRAYMMSGAALQRKILKPYTVEKMKKFWDVVCEKANCQNMDQLKYADPKTLYYAWLDAQKEFKFSMPYTFPVYDGKLLKKETFDMNHIPDMPYIIGMTTNDMIPFGLEITNKSWAKKAYSIGSPCYLYDFDRDLPGDDKGTWHCCDMLYVFSTLGISWRPFDEDDYKLSKIMNKMLCNFAKTGNPNCDGLPYWEANYQKIMKLNKECNLVNWETKKNFINTVTGKGTAI